MTIETQSTLPLSFLHAVEMQVTVELGRTSMAVRDILGLASGSIVELDRAAGAPVDLFVNGTLFARGEVVVVDEEFGVRVTEIVNADGLADDARRGLPTQRRTSELPQSQ